jgi:hypothetical protein
MSIEQMIETVTAAALEQTAEVAKKHFEDGVKDQHMIMIAFD